MKYQLVLKSIRWSNGVAVDVTERPLDEPYEWREEAEYAAQSARGYYRSGRGLTVVIKIEEVA